MWWLTATATLGPVLCATWPFKRVKCLLQMCVVKLLRMLHNITLPKSENAHMQHDLLISDKKKERESKHARSHARTRERKKERQRDSEKKREREDEKERKRESEKLGQSKCGITQIENVRV